MYYTKIQLYKQLEQINAPKKSVVMVHSSLRAVGDTEGRGEGLLEVLIDYFTSEGGLLCIRTDTWAFNDEFALAMMSDKTCVGVLTQIAARHPSAHRSQHPTHSTAVFGNPEKAEEYIAFDSVSQTSTNPSGCYGRLYTENGYVMLIGVGHNKNTYIHSVEEMLNVPNRLSKEPLNLKIRKKDGTVVMRQLHCHRAEGIGDVSAHYPKYEPAFRYNGCIVDGKLGNADIQLCSAVKMKNTVELIRKRSGGAELLSDDVPLDEKLYK